jgi:hypothetical protein
LKRGAIFGSCSAFSRLDEEHVGARLPVLRGALERGVEALDRDRVGAGDDDEVRIDARVGGGADLGDRLFHRHHLLAGKMAAALGDHLVLEMHAGHARALIALDRAPDIQHPAVAVVGIGDERQPARLGDAARVVDHLGHGQQADVGHAQAHRRWCPAPVM